MAETPDLSKTADFLLEEYKELNNTLHINEERGEKRLEFFVTLSSVVLGAIGLFIKEFEDYNQRFLTLIYLIVILFLLGLMCIGFIVQKRLQKRNEITDGLKTDIKEIRNIFQSLDETGVILPPGYTAFSNRNQPDDISGSGRRKFTSLFHIASIINCVIAGAAFAFITFSCNLPQFVVIGSSFIAAIITGVLLLFPNKKSELLTHAGGLVYKTENGKKKYLVVTSSRDTNRWVLPKGHIEKGETAEFAAIREVMEETGIFARPKKVIGYQRFEKSNEKVHVKYYLMKYMQAVTVSSEQRKQLWLSKEDAIKKVTFADTKKLIQNFL